MVSALRLAVGLLAVGLALVAIPLFAVGPPPSATYYVEATVVEELDGDATVVALEDVDRTVRANVSRAIGSTGGVAAGSTNPDVPQYVRADGRVYQLVVAVADPGGGGAVLKLASVGSGLAATALGVVALAVAAWRRVR